MSKLQEFCKVVLSHAQEELVDEIMGHLLIKMIEDKPSEQEIYIDDLRTVKRILSPGVRLAVKYLKKTRFL